jgi:hypothetical protein
MVQPQYPRWVESLYGEIVMEQPLNGQKAPLHLKEIGAVRIHVDHRWPIGKGGQLTLQSGAQGCKPLQVVAGARFDLNNAYPIIVPVVPASLALRP